MNAIICPELKKLDSLLKKLDDENLSLIIINDNEIIFSSKKEGMIPLLEAVEMMDALKLSGSIVIDKIIGKAAALIICYFKAKVIHTKILSLKAIKILNDYSIEYSAEKTIPEIMNKPGTDICPFEKTVSDTNSTAEGYIRLKELVKKMNIHS